MYDIEHAVNHPIGNKFREERATKNGARGGPRGKWGGCRTTKRVPKVAKGDEG